MFIATWIVVFLQTLLLLRVFVAVAPGLVVDNFLDVAVLLALILLVYHRVLVVPSMLIAAVTGDDEPVQKRVATFAVWGPLAVAAISPTVRWGTAWECVESVVVYFICMFVVYPVYAALFGLLAAAFGNRGAVE